jgi:hypothetical protein
VSALLVTEYYSGDQNKEKEMGMACVKNGEEGKYIRGFGGEN